MRSRNLTIFCACLFLFVFVKSSQAQPFSKKPLSPAKMCHKLGEKRTKKFKKKFRFKKQTNDISRISYKPYDSHYKRSTLQAKVISKKDILSVPELITTNTENISVSETLPTPLNNRHSEIRKLVEENSK